MKASFLPALAAFLLAGLTGLWTPAAPAQAAVEAGASRLAVGDSLEIRVHRHEDLSGRFILGQDGAVGLPFIEQVVLAGLTPEQAAKKIESLLADGWLRKPQVTVNVAEFAKNLITVRGEVNKGGGFSVPRNKPLTISQAIGMAGGFTNRANQKAVVLQRGDKAYSVDVKDILENPGKDRPLKDGDVLVVKSSIL